MTTSAFGVDHGEFSKARGGRRKRGVPPSAPQASTAQRMGIGSPGSKAGKLKAIPGKIGNAKVSINDVGRGVGRGVNAVGVAAAKKPTLTGLAVLGGGGYGAYRGLQSERLPKKNRNA